MTKRQLAPVLCVFLLLFAQQSAFVHAAFHATSDHAPTQQNGKDASFQSALCGLHGALNQVLGGLQPDVHHEPVCRRVLERAAHRIDTQVFPELHVPLSRGPPYFS